MPTTVSLSELLGAPVLDPAGAVGGRVREVALYPQEDRVRIAAFIVNTREGDRMLSQEKFAEVQNHLVRAGAGSSEWTPLSSSEGFLLLDRDLLDQQIIDVHGRKVVRVNDVDLTVEQNNGRAILRISNVEIGPRGAVRRLLKGVVPRPALNALVARLKPKLIPWAFVDLIETDPARRVRLRIEHARLAKLHPADLADILEELPQAERASIFESLDEDVAAETLAEIDRKLQASLLAALDSDHAADIVEEMDPDAAANLLADLPEETSEEILEEMEPEEREEVEELLEYEEDTAAGHMTTDYIAAPPSTTVEQSIDMIRQHEGGVETVGTIYLIDVDDRLVGAVPLAMIALAPPGALLSALSADPVISCKEDAGEKEVAELFDKYNLLTLPVVNEEGKLTGLITADDVISLLRSKL